MRKKKWIVEILLVVAIIIIGFLIFYLVNDGSFGVRKIDQEADSEPKAATNEQETSLAQDQSRDQDQQLQTHEDSEVIAPDFELMTTLGETISLSDYRGKVIIVNFWATWCPPCRAEMPLFKDAAEKFIDSLVVLAVNSGEEINLVKEFSLQFEPEIIFLLDSDYSVGELYQVRGLPTTYFVDSKGYVQAMHIGELSESLLASYLKGLGIQQ